MTATSLPEIDDPLYIAVRTTLKDAGFADIVADSLASEVHRKAMPELHDLLAIRQGEAVDGVVKGFSQFFTDQGNEDLAAFLEALGEQTTRRLLTYHRDEAERLWPGRPSAITVPTGPQED